MPVLTNTRYETFCQELFSGKSQTEAAKIAGYKPSAAAVIATRLVKKSECVARLNELKELAADSAVMSVRERKLKLTEIARKDWINKDGPTAAPVISAIHTLNRMDNVYKDQPVNQDNRQYNILVMSESGKRNLQRVINGEGTERKCLPEAAQ